MENITLNLRTKNPLEVFKSIRINENQFDRFTGHFPYIRTFYKDYDYEKGDILDKQILESVKSIFPDSHLSLNTLILFDEQYDKCLNLTKGAVKKTIVTYFYPIIKYDEISNDFKAYYLGLDLNLLMTSNDKRLQLIPENFIVNIPFNELETLIKTIKPVK